MNFFKRILPAAIVLIAVAAPEAGAVVGNTYLTAYSRTKGTQAKAGKYGTQILLRTKSRNSTTRTTKSGKKVKVSAYQEKVTFCKRTYYTTKRGKSWIAAHRRALPPGQGQVPQCLRHPPEADDEKEGELTAGVRFNAPRPHQRPNRTSDIRGRPMPRRGRPTYPQ